ncbi:hypothetical protein KC19_2G019900 [Ceratodon purpureus]|uniref:Uncharacterized protein n=1 Tax=Ceratodon purpureus TaxID=3225 RepID=A0A8T0IQT2_CERPU|nr:hypothetical protein KC19_2G019900 [Ceratodon purpureus]
MANASPLPPSLWMMVTIPLQAPRITSSHLDAVNAPTNFTTTSTPSPPPSPTSSPSPTSPPSPTSTPSATYATSATSATSTYATSATSATSVTFATFATSATSTKLFTLMWMWEGKNLGGKWERLLMTRCLLPWNLPLSGV